MTAALDTQAGDAAQLLRGFGSATVYEASGRRGLLDADWRQVVPGSRAAGRARTALCGQADNRAVHAAMDRLQPGEVLVLTMPDPVPIALIGDLLATQAKAQGAAAVLVDGAVRDVEDLAALGLPIWMRWTRIAGAGKQEGGELDVPVTVGGAQIAPGDWVVLDADGGVTFPATLLEQILRASAARCDKEDTLRARYAAGELSYDLYGFRVDDEQRGPVS